MIVAQVFNGSYAFAQENVGRTFAREVLCAFIAQSMHIDVVQEMLPGTVAINGRFVQYAPCRFVQI
jgi:hypothetical protein